MESVKLIVTDEIKNNMEHMDGMDKASKEYALLCETTMKMVDRLSSIEKEEQALKESVVARVQQAELKRVELTNQKTLKIAEIAVPATIACVTLAVKNSQFIKTLKFEEFGTVASIAGRNIVNNLFR